jgi:hypothetical protein
MKKIIGEIRKWGTMGAFIGAAVFFYLEQAKTKEYIESREKDRQSIDSNTAVVTKVLYGQEGIFNWMESHNIRHNDHDRVHDAENKTP